MVSGARQGISAWCDMKIVCVGVVVGGSLHEVDGFDTLPVLSPVEVTNSVPRGGQASLSS